MNYAILRTKKIKKSSLGGMTSHIARTRETLNADQEKKEENIILAGVDAKEAHIELLERINAIEATNGRKTRKDAVACIEVLMTTSPEYMQGADSDKVQEWAEKSIEWTNEHFGKNNMVSATLHLDETTPHIHAMVIPENDKGKLCAKDWLGGRDKLSAMQDEYAEHMQSLSLERGKKGSKAKHTEIKKWYAKGLLEAQKEVAKLEEQAELLNIVIEKTLGEKIIAITEPWLVNTFQQLNNFKEKFIDESKQTLKEKFREIKIKFLTIEDPHWDTWYEAKGEAMKKLDTEKEGLGAEFREKISRPEELPLESETLTTKSYFEVDRKPKSKEKDDGFEIG